MKLYYSHNLNPRVAVASARHLGVPVEFIRADPRNPAKQEAFRAINPNTLVPVLVEVDRTYWEADAIACRLSALVGSDFWRRDDEEAEMIMWVSWATHHLNRQGDPVIWFLVTLPSFSDEKPDERAVAEGLAGFRENAAILDAALANRDFLVGNRLSYADFRVATLFPFSRRGELPIAEFPNVVRWYARLAALHAWREPFAGLA